MTTWALMNFENGLVEDSANRAVTFFPSQVSVTSSAARFGTNGLLFTATTSFSFADNAPLGSTFTEELWFRIPATAGSKGLISVSGSSQYHLMVTPSGFLSTHAHGAIATGTTLVPTGVWNHAALIRIGDTLRIFLNGVLEVQTSIAVNTDSLRLDIGSVAFQSNAQTDVAIDGLRIVTGAALYTQPFTPPTTPPTVEYTLQREYNLAAQIGVGELMPLNPATTLPSQPVVFRFDPQLGTATLTGTVKTLGAPNQPVARRVILIEERSGNVIRETVSDPLTGVYAFSELLPQARYTVLAYDHTGYYRAVIADNLSAT
jgi:hypothetical protein